MASSNVAEWFAVDGRSTYHRRMRRSAAVLISGILILTACTGSADPDASGEELYSQFCTRCHGSDRSGWIGPSLGQGSDLVDRPDSYIGDVIGGGRGRMPAFGNTLSDEQIGRVVEFIRSEQSP